MIFTDRALSAKMGLVLSAFRAKQPLVHNITNFVAMDISANVLLAAGASPAMIHAVDEAGEFAKIADAIVINIGTLSPLWVESMLHVADGAQLANKPWVLDPVGVGATQYRNRVASQLTKHQPTAIRGNASEILSLARVMVLSDVEGSTRGVDSSMDSEAAQKAAKSLAKATGGVVAVTGRIDYVTDGSRLLSIENGHPMMTKVTAVGCSLSALVAGFLAVEPDSLLAVASAIAMMGICGEIASEQADGPGTFRVKLLDALYQVTSQKISESARVSMSVI